MRILMIGQKGIPARYGGIERHVEELSVELAKSGQDVFVYARNWYTPKNIDWHRGVKIIHTPTIRTKHLDTIVHTFISSIHALFQKPDIIHYHGVGPALLSFIPRLFLPKTKVVVTFHCVDRYHQKWGLLARLILRLGEKAACIFPHETIAVSKSIKQYCLNEYTATTTYIPNGARKIENADPKFLNQWNLQSGKYIFMASRLVKHKGAHYLIDAWKKLRAQKPELMNEYKLVIAGGSVFTDEYVKTLHSQAKNDESIILTGWVDGESLDTLFAHAALLVHPSENEGLPLTVLTAMAAGIPALVSDIAEHTELISNPDWLCATTNTNELAAKLQAALENPEKRAVAGMENAKKVAITYSWPVIAQSTVIAYQD